MDKESKFEAELVEEIRKAYPGAIIIKIDPSLNPGYPDRLVLFRGKWAAFDAKSHKKAKRRPNQEYYINVLNGMSYATFVHPRNKEIFLYELQQTFRPPRRARLPGSK